MKPLLNKHSDPNIIKIYSLLKQMLEKRVSKLTIYAEDVEC